MIVPYLPPSNWDYRHVIPHLAWKQEISKPLEKGKIRISDFTAYSVWDFPLGFLACKAGLRLIQQRQISRSVYWK
jgi:hypothetical protein